MSSNPSKTPGSYNPPAPWDVKGWLGMKIVTTTPNMSQVMGLPGQIPSPIVNEVNDSMNTIYMDAGPGVSGVINTEKGANVS